MANFYSVTQINSYIKNMFQQDFVLNKISIKGEVSNCKYHTSGHIYFTLKDAGGTITAVMFAGQAKNLTFRLAEGQQVIAKGRIDVYERDGKYQLYVNEIEQEGAGDLFRKFEELKKSLEEMGMFSREYKREIPRFASKVGIVTASTGAAVQDIINISKRRNPYVQLVLYPAQVQGESAKYSIVKGIEALDRLNLDVIIVGRGGGSIEDLWAFNEEIVANAIFNCTTPVISAVGHETDFTIADFVSDMRAPTPSAAAELAVADIHNIQERIYSYNIMLNQGFTRIIEKKKNQLERSKMRLSYQNPIAVVQEKRQRAIDMEDKLQSIFMTYIKERRHKLSILTEKMEGMSPLLKLRQGYSYTESSTGKNVNSVADIEKGDIITVNVSDGRISAQVTNKEKVEKSNGKSDNT